MFYLWSPDALSYQWWIQGVAPACTPYRSRFFHFDIQIFRKVATSGVGAPPWGWHPSYGKSWICYWLQWLCFLCLSQSSENNFAEILHVKILCRIITLLTMLIHLPSPWTSFKGSGVAAGFICFFFLCHSTIKNGFFLQNLPKFLASHCEPSTMEPFRCIPACFAGAGVALHRDVQR